MPPGLLLCSRYEWRETPYAYTFSKAGISYIILNRKWHKVFVRLVGAGEVSAKIRSTSDYKSWNDFVGPRFDAFSPLALNYVLMLESLQGTWQLKNRRERLDFKTYIQVCEDTGLSGQSGLGQSKALTKRVLERGLQLSIESFMPQAPCPWMAGMCNSPSTIPFNVVSTWNYCALWAYVSCHVYFSVLFSKRVLKKNEALQRSLFDSGELAVTSLSHSHASRLWVWLYTSVKLGVCLYIDRLLEKF